MATAGVVESRRCVRGGHRRQVAVIGAASLLASIAFVDGAEAQPDPTGFSELAVGDWFGNGRAGGTTATSGGGLAISGQGDFTTNMEFGVDIDGSLEGTWVLEGESTFAFATPQIAFQDMMVHSSAGAMAGNSERFSLGTAQIDTTHNVVGDVTYSGTSSDPIGPINLQVTGIYCTDAWGVWVVSWNTELADQNYTPTFDGDWYAVRQSAEFSGQDGSDDALGTISMLYIELVQEMLDLASSQPGDGSTGLVLPANALWEFVYRLVDVYNALRNLTPCDRALIGDEAIEQWIFNVTSNIAVLIRSLLAQYELGADDLNNLVNIAGATGAIGEGSLYGDSGELARELDSALQDVANDSSASTSDRISAEATRWQHGLVFE